MGDLQQSYLLGCLFISVIFLCVYYSEIGNTCLCELKNEYGMLLLVTVEILILLSWVSVIVFLAYVVLKQYKK